MELLNSLDCWLLKRIYYPNSPLWLNDIVGIFSDYRIWVFVCVLVVSMGIRTKDRKYFYSLVLIALCVGLSDFISSQVLKSYFGRARPCLGDCISTLRWACGSYYSFPSSHATNAMAMLTVGIFFIPSRTLTYLLFVIALLIGYSRSFFGVHYPGDVLGGFLIGATTSGLTCLMLKRLLKIKNQGATRI